MTQEIKASEINPGMILNVQMFGEKTFAFNVYRVEKNIYGAVIVTDFLGNSTGFSIDETVKVVGYFNA